jgi:hypothetical protein
MHGLSDPFAEWRRLAAIYRQKHGAGPLQPQPRPARPLTEAELQIWRSLYGAMNPDGQRASDAELARERQAAENSPAARRIRQRWNERDLGEDWR